MKATVTGKVLAKKIVEPKPGSNASTKYIAAIHQPGELEAAQVNVNAKQYESLVDGKEVSLEVRISAWKTDRSYGLNVSAVQ